MKQSGEQQLSGKGHTTYYELTALAKDHPLLMSFSYVGWSTWWLMVGGAFPEKAYSLFGRVNNKDAHWIET